LRLPRKQQVVGAIPTGGLGFHVVERLRGIALRAVKDTPDSYRSE
jgi:hypothetical protein